VPGFIPGRRFEFYPMNNQQNSKKVQIKMNDETAKGFYSNLMICNHTKEEFIFDLLNVFGGGGVAGARIITSPGHFKRMIKAMEGSMKKYEERFGEVKEATPEGSEIGFKE
jgi:hypothetical protein